MLVGTESIRVVVNGVATLIGAVIAHGKVDGQWRITEDHGDLQFEAKQLVAKDIHNVEAGLTLGGGFSGNAANPNRATYSVKFGGMLKDQKVHASCGHGNVVVHDNPAVLESINRDVGALVEKGINFEVRPITVYVPTLLLHPEETAKHVAGRIQDMASWLEQQSLNLGLTELKIEPPTAEEQAAIDDVISSKEKAKTQGNEDADKYGDDALDDLAAARQMRQNAKNLRSQNDEHAATLADALDQRAQQLEDGVQATKDILDGKPVSTEIPEDVAKKLGIPKELPKTPAGVRTAKMAQKMANDKNVQRSHELQKQVEQSVQEAAQSVMSGDERKAMQMADKANVWMNSAKAMGKDIVIDVISILIVEGVTLTPIGKLTPQPIKNLLYKGLSGSLKYLEARTRSNGGLLTPDGLNALEAEQRDMEAILPKAKQMIGHVNFQQDLELVIQDVITGMKHIAPNTWQSPGGLVFGEDGKYGNRVAHILNHMGLPNNPNSKGKHGVFIFSHMEVFQLLDEASGIRRQSFSSGENKEVFDINMGRTIGTKGEAILRLVVEVGTNNVISAYPIN